MADPTTGPTTTSPPGSGGWVPSPFQRWSLTLAVTALGGVPVLLLADPISLRAVCVSVLSGVLSGLTAFLGISSAGPRAPGAP